MTAWRIRPSSLARIVACPASLQVSDGAPSYMDDEYTDNTTREEGTACHWLAHQNALGVTVPAGTLAPNEVEVDGAMQAASDLYLANINKWQSPQVSFEVPLQVPLIPNCSGTPDAAALGIGNTVHVADLKYGFKVVDVWPNYQLAAYGIAKAAAHGLPLEACTYHLTIVQPRRWHRAGPVQSALVGGAEMLKVVQQAASAAQEALGPNPAYRPGTHCKHCPGRTRCKALRDGEVVDNLFVDPHDLPFEAAEQELAFLERRAGMLDAYISGLRQQVEHGLRNGQRSSKYELRKQSGALEWIPGTEAQVRALASLCKVNVDKPADLITPTQARDKLGEQIVNIYSRRKPGASKLVPVDAEIWKRIFNKD